MWIIVCQYISISFDHFMSVCRYVILRFAAFGDLFGILKLFMCIWYMIPM